ncbi:MAG TPA: hypothetical protein VJ063_16030 [Verrucomicrobiae bacterium]|nr:hypothetical protein [Verrucomicrobiae bacterium]
MSATVAISVDGEMLTVPSLTIDGKTVVVTGGRLKIASVADEEFIEGEAVEQPDAFVEHLRQQRITADIFTFARKQGTATLRVSHFMEWDNAAVISIKSYAEWLEKLSQDTRRNVRKAAKAGVVLKQMEFSDELVRGISDIYNETPVRQGRPFWHYGKDLETVKRENGTFLNRSVFIGAFLKDELIGFLKMVYVERTASIMQILTKNQHYDKRPANALIAKAVEICGAAGMTALVYCKYIYGKNDESPLTEFKRRSGFEQVLYARYYVPLTLKGRVALTLRLHHGISGIVPKRLWLLLLGVRARFYESRKQRKAIAPMTPCTTGTSKQPGSS